MKTDLFANMQSLKVTVERVMPYGVFVRLPNGEQGYIRKRELDLDADVEPADLVQVGQKIEVVVIDTNDSQGHIELSRRATLKDPWPDFSRKFHEGETIRGTVRALRPNGVFIRVQAGIKGFVPINEMTTWEVKKTEDILWIGDAVEAEIIYLDRETKRLTLSIKSRMAQRDNKKYNEYSHNQSDLQLSTRSERKSLDPIASEIRELVGTILIVDDHNEVRTSLKSWLNYRGFYSLEAESLDTAVIQVQTNNCQVLIVDLNLVEKDGLELIRQLRNNGNKAHICVMSDMDTLTERAKEINAAEVAQVFPKPLDLEEIEEFLIRLAYGEPIQPWRATSRAPSLTNEISGGMRDTITSHKSLQATLAQITQLLRAEVGLIFRLDMRSQSISVIAQTGNIPIRADGVYGLNASPVKDVMREGEPVFENHVTAVAKEKFDKLLELLPFESCIGVPIHVNNEIQHAVFFFHGKPESFSHYRLRDAQAGSVLFAALITRDMVEHQLQSLNPVILSGELARGFGHDVFNKITALDLETSVLNGQSSLAEIQAAVQHLLAHIRDLKETVHAFQQMMQTKEIQDDFDVNQVIEQAIELFHSVAQKEHAKIELNLAHQLPSLKGNRIALQQVFLNLMINAIQQMSLKAGKFQWDGNHILRITTSLNEKAQLVRIRFADNGPGIHYAHLGKLFSPGFSTRGGSGLGLSIARGFIQSLGGVLRVQETLVPLGTTFVVEVPYITKETFQ